MEQARKDIVTGFLIYGLNILLLYYLWQNNILLTAILIFISGFVLLKGNKEERIVFLASFIFGPIIDFILVPRGVWTYGNPSIFGVPLWLPFLYGIFTVNTIKIGKSIRKIL